MNNLKILLQEQINFDHTNKFNERIMNSTESKENQMVNLIDPNNNNSNVEKSDDEELYNRIQEEANKRLIGSAENFKKYSLQQKNLQRTISETKKNILSQQKELKQYMIDNNIPFFEEKSSNNRIVLITEQKKKVLSQSEIKNRFINLFGIQNGLNYYKKIYEENRENICTQRIVYKTESEIKKDEELKKKQYNECTKHLNFLDTLSENFTENLTDSMKQEIKMKLLRTLDNLK